MLVVEVQTWKSVTCQSQLAYTLSTTLNCTAKAIQQTDNRRVYARETIQYKRRLVSITHTPPPIDDDWSEVITKGDQSCGHWLAEPRGCVLNRMHD